MARPADPNAKEALVAAARKEFARRSLQGARVEDITAACGLSKGAFYLHFPSKESLFGELIAGFFGALEEMTERRRKAVLGFFAGRPDFAVSESAAQALLELESRLDLAALEVMWEYRDVLGVLINGCQGTRFEGAVWQMVDREMARLKQNFEEFKHHQLCRADVPFEVLGSMIIGTYLLLGMRMSRAARKPDLLEWARTLHVLLKEGNAPAHTHLHAAAAALRDLPKAALDPAPAKRRLAAAKTSRPAPLRAAARTKRRR